MSESQLRAAIVAIAPVVLLVGFVYHPYVVNGTDEVALATAAASDPTRWGLAHLLIGIGYALAAVAFVAVRAHLREAGEDLWSRRALPLAVVGCALFPILTGMEFALLAAVETGGDGAAAQAEVMPWFVPVLAMGAVSFALGAIFFALAIARVALQNPFFTRLAAGGLVVMAVVRFIPLGASQIVIGIAAIAGFWPLASDMLRRPSS